MGGEAKHNLVGKPLLRCSDNCLTVLDNLFWMFRPAELVPHDEWHHFRMIVSPFWMIFHYFWTISDHLFWMFRPAELVPLTNGMIL